MKSSIYNYEDLFHQDPDDPNQTILIIPDNFAESLNLKPGDVVNVIVDDNTLIVKKSNLR